MIARQEIVLLALCGTLARAESPQEAARRAMESSIAKQRQAVAAMQIPIEKQRAAVGAARPGTSGDLPRQFPRAILHAILAGFGRGMRSAAGDRIDPR